MSDISFLPSDLKEQEEEIKKQSLKTAPEESVSMHVPESEEEDVEIIEVDASEVDQMLIGEPLYTRLYYRASLFIDTLKEKYLKPRPIEPPSKTPPQFFKPPQKSKEDSKISVPSAAEPVQPKPRTAQTPSVPAVSKAKIRPAAMKPASGRRVRIIKRVRKPVHVSLLDDQMMRELHINIPKRKFTLVFLTLLFAIIFGGAYLLFDQAIVQATAENGEYQKSFNGIHGLVVEEQNKWRAFQDLEPRLLALGDLLETHISANRVLAFLEQNTLQDVSYSSFLMSEDGKISLNVTAMDYTTAASQLMVFENSPLVQSAEAASFSRVSDLSGEFVTFQLTLQLKPEALRFLEKEEPPILAE